MHRSWSHAAPSSRQERIISFIGAPGGGENMVNILPVLFTILGKATSNPHQRDAHELAEFIPFPHRNQVPARVMTLRAPGVTSPMVLLLAALPVSRSSLSDHSDGYRPTRFQSGVEMLRTNNPGRVCYQDRFQVAAIPWRRAPMYINGR